MIISKNWLIDRGYLHSEGAWRKLVAGRYYPKKKLKLFMTGDAHSKFPFRWASHGFWKDYLQKYIDSNKICCHVEQHQKKVTSSSVIPYLRKVYSNKKVFGWEPKAFLIIPEILEYLDKKRKNFHYVNKTDIADATKKMKLVSKQSYLQDEYNKAKEILKKLSNGNISENDASGKFRSLLNKYYGQTLELRLDPKVHKDIGSNIMKIIKKYKNDVHLITVGAEHMGKNINPLYNFIEPPYNCFGIADESNGK